MKRPTALLLAGLFLLTASAAASQETASPATPPATAPVTAAPGRAGQDFITLNFTNIDIAALVKVMSELTRRNFILDDKVAGKLTLMTPTRITADEAYQVFLSALEIKGYTAVEDGKAVRIVPSAAARQSGLKVVPDGDMRGEGFVTKLARLTYVNSQEVVRTLSPLISKDGNLIAYPATNSVIITDSVSNIRKIESLVKALDVAAPGGKGKINVYYLKNGNAEDISKVLSTLVARIPTAAAAGGPGGAAPAGPVAILEGTVTITADKATNSLIVVASPIDYETIKDVLQKLDIRRRQVYVEAAIIEMSLAKQRDLGFEFQAVSKLKDLETSTNTAYIGGTNFGNIGPAIANGPAGLASLTGLTVGAVKGTFKYNGTEFLSVGALLHALQTDGDVNVLSTPNILTTDNQKAEIMVGQNVPFLTGQTQNATTGPTTLFNTIERKDVGIKLTITPQITSDDNVRLDVNQEISDVIASSTSNPAGLTTSKRSAVTTVVVKDQQTMVIGGLIRDNTTSSTSKIPLLGDIPILGWLFKFNTTKTDKTNLMIFITPYIIKNENEAGEITKEKSDEIERFREKYRIEKKEESVLREPIKRAPQIDEKEQPADQSAAGKPEEKPAETPAESAPAKPSETSAGQPTPAPSPGSGVSAPPPPAKPAAPPEAPKEETR